MKYVSVLFALLLLVPVAGICATPPSTGLVADYTATASVNGYGEGASIPTLVDVSGNGYNATQSSGTYQATATYLDPSGYAALEFNEDFYNLPAAVSVNSQSFTVAVIYSDWGPQNFNSTDCFFSIGTAGQIALYRGNSTNDLNINGSTKNFTGMPFFSVGPSLVYVTGSATATTMGDQILSQSLSAGSSITPTGGQIGSYTSGGEFYHAGAIYEVLIYNATLTGTELGQLKTYAETQYGIGVSQTKQLVMMGDGKPNGASNTDSQSYPNILAVTSGFDKYVRVIAAGVGSKTLSSMSTDYTTVICPACNAGFAENDVFIDAGINDIAGGTSPSSVEGYLRTLVNGLKTNCGSCNFNKVYVSSQMVAGSSTYDSNRTTYNSWVRSNWNVSYASGGVGADGFVDLGGPYMPDGSTTNGMGVYPGNSTLILGANPTNAGALQMVNSWLYPAFSSMLPGTTINPFIFDAP